MLSCETIQELLPGLVTGEKTEHEVREHLARCDECRAERDRLAAEIAEIREDLAVLAPSPFLEDALVDAAHETESVAPTRRPWRYVAVAFAAAAALFLVVLLPRLQYGGGEEPFALPGGEGDGELVAGHGAGVEVPPSLGEVTKAREGNRSTVFARLGGTPTLKSYDTWPDGVPTDQESSERFLPPAKDALQRYVYLDKQGQPGSVTHRMASLPSVEGVFFLGNELLADIGGTLHAGIDGEILLGDKRWSTTPGTMQGEITVGSPDTGGAEARVRVHVSTGYSGTLMLEDPLARALGLHQFEIPGGVEFETPDGTKIPVHGWRARARIAIPELGFDRVVEVQVVRARPWMVKRGRRSRTTGLLFRGSLPSAVIRADTLHGAPDGGYDLTGGELTEGEKLEHVEVPRGTHRFVLKFSPPPGGAVPMLPDIPLLGELFRTSDSILIPQALDFHGESLHVIDVGHVRLEGQWTPGARVTIARVWRGKTAIPSAEAVVQTQVSESGRVAFPRIAGEKGSTLRMLVTTKDGTSTFHDVVVAPELLATPRLQLSLGADGIVAGPGWTVEMIDGDWQDDDATGAPSPERFAYLVQQLKWHAGPEDRRDADGNSRTHLALRAAKDTPWRMVQWIMMAAADPRVRIHMITLVAADEGGDIREDIRVPSDQGLSAKQPVRVVVELVRATEGGELAIRYGPEDGPLVPVKDAELTQRLGDLLREVDGAATRVVGLVKVPPPGRVTSAEAARVINAFREAGIEDVVFEGAPLR